MKFAHSLIVYYLTEDKFDLYKFILKWVNEHLIAIGLLFAPKLNDVSLNLY